MALRAGDWVEVRSKEEILATLDPQGRLENMPFMPEMFAFCGRRMRVQRRAHKTCDTINPHSSRSLLGGILLEGVRCDGAAHGGCQAMCSIFWKEAWLKPVGGGAQPAVATGATEEAVIAAAQDGMSERGEIRYRCQATDVPLFTKRLRTRDLRQYAEDIASGNESLGAAFRTMAYFTFDYLFRPAGDGREGYRRFYDWFQALWGGIPYPRRFGLLAEDAEQPLVALDLQPGELVRVKSYEEILSTLNRRNKNRGLYFDAEMVPYCGGVFRVRSRIDHFLDERTGVMRKMKTPAVILEGVWCRSRFSNYRVLCPRMIYSWWREAWLERAPEGASVSVAGCLGARGILNERAAEEAGA
jgi:hypothetical protein